MLNILIHYPLSLIPSFLNKTDSVTSYGVVEKNQASAFKQVIL